MDGLLRVVPEELVAASNEFSTKAGTVGNLTSEMMNLVVSLSGGCEGEGSTAYIGKFKNLEEDIQKIVRMIQEHSSDLNEMANRYKGGEAEVVELAQSLPGDVIV